MRKQPLKYFIVDVDLKIEKFRKRLYIKSVDFFIQQGNEETQASSPTRH